MYHNQNIEFITECFKKKETKKKNSVSFCMLTCHIKLILILSDIFFPSEEPKEVVSVCLCSFNAKTGQKFSSVLPATIGIPPDS